MSLFKQLWLAIIFLLTLVFGGSFAVTSLSAKAYLEEQLRMKNADNATALALSLTQQGADEVLLELTLAAQFDTGFYEMIQLSSPEGEELITRIDNQPIDDAPGWFMSLFELQVEPGVATIQQGWQQIGTLTLRSHTRFAYRELWESTQKMALVFLLAMIASGFLGSYLLKTILRPLDDVVTQAEAIGNRQFITTEEPRTLEFRKLVSTMNELSRRIKSMLQQEAKRLEKWQRDANIDKVTQLLNREPFLKGLEAALASDDVNATGALGIVRLEALAHLNQVYGRKAIDSMLRDVGNALNAIALKHSRWSAARLNGGDFALMAPRATDPVEPTRDIQEAMREVLIEHSMEADVPLPASCTIFEHGNSVGELLTRLDSTLLSVQEEGESRIGVAHPGDIPMQPVREQMKEWRNIFETSFTTDNFELVRYPVVDSEGDILHHECPVRLRWQGDLIAAGRFLPWINRLEMSEQLDRRVIDLALKEIEQSGGEICVNLSVASVVDPGFSFWFSERLSTHSEAARHLWIEVPESMAFRHLAMFKKLSSSAKSFGAHTGIEHMGHQLSELGQLHDIGIDYLKVDANFIRDIDENVANQTLLRTLATVGHSIGVKIIAESVRSDSEWEKLRELGFDGATGPLFVDS